MNAGPTSATQRLLSLALVPLAVWGAAGCVDARRGGRVANAKSHGKVDAAAELTRLMSRESGTFPKHRLQLFGGLVTGDEGASPCGICRQVLAEFATDMPIVMVGLGSREGETGRVVQLADLLPLAFKLKN